MPKNVIGVGRDQNVLIVGNDQLRIAEADTIEKSFKKFGAGIKRHAIAGMNWGQFVSDLAGCSRLLLCISTNKYGVATDRRKSNIGEMFDTLSSSFKDLSPSIGVLFLDMGSVQEFGWIIEDGYAELAFSVAPKIQTAVPTCTRKMLVDDLTDSRRTDDMATALLTHRAHKKKAA